MAETRNRGDRMIKEEFSEICEYSPAFSAEQEHWGSVLKAPGQLEKVVLEQETQIMKQFWSVLHY